MRSLILAGGGLKIAYQAGCLQVLLDEAQIAFDHVDAVSGGCFNAVLWANGYSGSEIAHIWRIMNPRDFLSLNFGGLRKLFWSRSIGTVNGMRRVFRDDWKLDFERIRRRTMPTFTFNVHNFSRKTVVIKEQSEMSEEYLLACVALVMWFPPVIIDGEIWFDAVWCRDSNVREAVRRGADEIWAIWTVSNIANYRDGFLAQYFHIIEAAANTRFLEEWREVAEVNASIDSCGMDGSRSTPDLRLALNQVGVDNQMPPPGRKRVSQHLIAQEVPLHYLMNLSRDRSAAAVEMGVADTRAYCLEQGLINRVFSASELPTTRAEGIAFTETMKGALQLGNDVSEAFESGAPKTVSISFQLTVSGEDIDQLLGSPDHSARATGEIHCRALSERPLRIISGTCKLFVPDRNDNRRYEPWHKRFIYELTFESTSGKRFLLHGEKILPGSPWPNPWRDTTTLFITVYKLSDAERRLYGTGILRMSVLAFMRELTTFRVSNATGPLSAIAAICRFGAFFVGQAWDVYLRRVLDYCPY